MGKMTSVHVPIPITTIREDNVVEITPIMTNITLLKTALETLVGDVDNIELTDLGVKMTSPYSGNLNTMIQGIKRDIENMKGQLGLIELKDTAIGLTGSHTGTKLNTWIAGVDGSLSTLRGKTDNATSDISALRARISTNESNISKLQSTTRTHTSDISSLKSRVSANETSIQAVANKLDIMATNLHSANASLINIIG